MYLLWDPVWQNLHIWMGRDTCPRREHGVLHFKKTDPRFDCCSIIALPFSLGLEDSVDLLIPDSLMFVYSSIYNLWLKASCLPLSKRRKTLAAAASIGASLAGTTFFATQGTPPKKIDPNAEKRLNPAAHFELDPIQLSLSLRSWAQRNRISQSKPTLLRVFPAQPKQQTVITGLPLFDHVSRTLQITVELKSEEVLVFTTERKWKRVLARKRCGSRNLFVFEPTDKFLLTKPRARGAPMERTSFLTLPVSFQSESRCHEEIRRKRG